MTYNVYTSEAEPSLYEERKSTYEYNNGREETKTSYNEKGNHRFCRHQPGSCSNSALYLLVIDDLAKFETDQDIPSLSHCGCHNLDVVV